MGDFPRNPARTPSVQQLLALVKSRNLPKGAAHKQITLELNQAISLASPQRGRLYLRNEMWHLAVRSMHGYAGVI